MQRGSLPEGDRAFALIEGNCIEYMKTLPDNCIDSICTDPPYGIGFMGRAWDSLPPGPAWAEQVIRVLKPGGHCVAFGATRTLHRLTCALEDAGLEVRDTFHWIYWSNFPKGQSISLSIDKHLGREKDRKVISRKIGGRGESLHGIYGDYAGEWDVTAPASDEAKQWDGWQTGLKAIIEPATLVRKPVTERSTAAQILATGTGALNIDACRHSDGDLGWVGPQTLSTDQGSSAWGLESGAVTDWDGHPLGRWPSHSLYCPKPSRSEKEAGCENLPEKHGGEIGDKRGRGTKCAHNGRGGTARLAGTAIHRCRLCRGTLTPNRMETRCSVAVDGEHDPVLVADHPGVRNTHLTVKPIGLMRWLCRLITPPGGLVFDPFTGSGTTGCAALLEGFRFLGCELENESFRIAEARIKHWAEIATKEDWRMKHGSIEGLVALR